MTENTPEEIGFSQAITEVEKIVSRIERDDIDLDELVSHVSRATSLIQMCRDRLRSTELAVREVLEQLEER